MNKKHIRNSCNGFRVYVETFSYTLLIQFFTQTDCCSVCLSSDYWQRGEEKDKHSFQKSLNISGKYRQSAGFLAYFCTAVNAHAPEDERAFGHDSV